MNWKTRRGSLNLTRHARVMGILNVTPDSFSDGGCHAGLTAALAHARRMIADGAEIIDIGGASTRPGSLPVPTDVELSRTLPVVAALRKEWDGLLSIDTTNAEVARAGLAAGIDIVNDVSGLRADPAMTEVCAASGCGVVVMHMLGTPENMQENPHYIDVVTEVRQFFASRLEHLSAAGITIEAVCFDPGIGFGKSLEHNLRLLGSLEILSVADRPLLLGVSRKSFIGQILGNPEISAREAPTVALTTFARGKNVMLHRVHNVGPNVRALRTIEAILECP